MVSLPVREQRALKRIEKRLLADDVSLGSLFTIFTRLALHDAMPWTERVQAGLGRLRPVLVAAAGLVPVAGALMVSFLVPKGQACPHPSVAAPAASQPQNRMTGCGPAAQQQRMVPGP
jgi:Protein of unknown function (DUF3040)